MSIHPGVVRAALRGCRPLLASRRITVGGKRRMYDLFTRVARVPRGTGYDGVTIAGVPVEGVRPPGVETPARRCSTCTAARMHWVVPRAIAAW